MKIVLEKLSLMSSKFVENQVGIERHGGFAVKLNLLIKWFGR